MFIFLLLPLLFSFLDRDMFMRYLGGGVGHLESAPDLDSTATSTEADETEADEGDTQTELDTIPSDNTTALDLHDGDDEPEPAESDLEDTRIEWEDDEEEFDLDDDEGDESDGTESGGTDIDAEADATEEDEGMEDSGYDGL